MLNFVNKLIMVYLLDCFIFKVLLVSQLKTDFKKWHIMKIKDNQIGLYVMLGCVWR